MKLLKPIMICTGLAFSGTATLADDKLERPPENIVEQTPPAELMDRDKEHLPEPEVRIIQREGATIEEYRVNGQLRYAKIKPSSGPAYYLVDTDGDGQLDSRHDDLTNPPVQQWILYQW